MNHGGKRKGAGRKAKQHGDGSRVEPSHAKRPNITKHRPLHITLEMAEDVPNLRAVNLAAVVIDAIGRANVREDFRVVHSCILGTHVHVIAEAHGRKELASGMKSLNGTIAKALNERLMKLAFEDAPLSFAEPMGNAPPRKAPRGKAKGTSQHGARTRPEQVAQVQEVGTPPNQVPPRQRVLL
jgi:REP element-mobilizing transposase RayT